MKWMKKMKLLSIVVPVFNEEENIFGNIVSVNMLCIHKDINIKVSDMDEVLDSNFHPMKR